MSSPSAFDAIHDHLVAQWSATPLVFENENWPTPDNPEPFVFVEIFGDFYDLASIGAGSVAANRWREAGQLLMHVMTPSGEGSRGARTTAKQILDLVRGQEIAGVIFRECSIGAGEPGTADGNYFRMTATANWERDD